MKSNLRLNILRLEMRDNPAALSSVVHDSVGLTSPLVNYFDLARSYNLQAAPQPQQATAVIDFSGLPTSDGNLKYNLKIELKAEGQEAETFKYVINSGTSSAAVRDLVLANIRL